MARTLVDLSMPISEEMPTNRPDHFPPSITPYSRLDEDGWRGSELRLDSHCGTHVDAPSHFIDGGASLDQIALDVLIGPCQVAHLSVTERSHAISPAELGAVDSHRLLVSTQWSRLAESDPEAYFTGNPFLDVETAQMLVDSDVRLVGVDSPSVDPPGSDAAHKILLGNGVTIIENLRRLELLPDSCGCIVLPLPIWGGDGSPARAVAVVGEEAS
jgi:arylformamidase